GFAIWEGALCPVTIPSNCCYRDGTRPNMFKPQPSELSTEPYLKIVRHQSNPNSWDLLGYNSRNELELTGSGLSFVEAVRRYGSPLEVRDTTIVERRCREWKAMGKEAAQKTNYD